MIITAFGDPEQDVLLAAMAAVTPPAGAVVPACALDDTISAALLIAKAHEGEAQRPGTDERGRREAARVAHAQHSIVTLFQRLLLDARRGGAA
jgi:hypothetical protein